MEGEEEKRREHYGSLGPENTSDPVRELKEWVARRYPRQEEKGQRAPEMRAMAASRLPKLGAMSVEPWWRYGQWARRP